MDRRGADGEPRQRGCGGVVEVASRMGSPTSRCGRKLWDSESETLRLKLWVWRLWDISKSANIWITGMPEGEEEEQEMENLFEKIMKEKFLNLA